VEDYFARERLSRFDARALQTLQPAEAAYGALAPTELSSSSSVALPLALITSGRGLPLDGGINPAWADRVEVLRTAALGPLLGDRTELSAADWATLRARLAPFAAWRAAEPQSPVAALGEARLKALLGSALEARLTQLCAADAAQRPQVEAQVELERLLRYAAHLGQLLRNFVSFADFYERRSSAIFQAGTVWFDQRRCDLVTQVADPGRHAILAGQSGAYLAYLDCVRKSDGRKVTVCAAVTDGESDNLMVGRNGIFYDRAGRDYDATITKIVDNPISVRQAFWSPYKKFVRAVEELISKRAAEADAKSQARVSAAAAATANADQAPAPADAAPAADKPLDVGVIAALGVAVGGVTAALGALLQAFFGLGIWMPLGILGLVLCISGPSMLIAALKLRRRNIGPILDADGWAVNAQARINIPFGRSLTRIATMPEGSETDLEDPFAAPSSGGRTAMLVLLLLALGAALIAWLHHNGTITLPGAAVMTEAPAAATPPAP
jgi:hypothetical protein